MLINHIPNIIYPINIYLYLQNSKVITVIIYLKIGFCHSDGFKKIITFTINPFLRWFLTKKIYEAKNYHARK